jgi:5-deoxy-glucuronate isomerase
LSLKYHYYPRPGYTPLVKPGDGGLRFVEFGVLRLEPGASYDGATGGREAFLVLLSGDCAAEVGGRRRTMRREDVFRQRASAVYLPPGSAFQVVANGLTELAVAFGPTDRAGEPRFVGPDDVRINLRGTPPYQRQVHDIAVNDFPAGRLLVGETFNFPGQWSSYPPHKHDETDPPAEYRLEEVYYYQVDPPQGFGLQWLYTRDGSLDEAHAVRHNDLTILPKGYHPVAAAPGYTVYYLWVLAGDVRTMSLRDDPDHAWIKNQP